MTHDPSPPVPSEPVTPPAAAPKSAPPRRYSGATGAVAYAGLTLSVALAVGLVASFLMATLTGASEVGAFIFLRILIFGSATAVAAGLARYIASGESDRLLSTRLVRGDLGGIAGLAAGLLVASSFASPPQAQGVNSPTLAPGDRPEFSGPVLTGGTWNLADHANRVVLIDFWATWCPPCIDELPFVRRAYDQFHDQGLDVVAVSLDGSRNALEQFLEQHPEPWPQIFYEPPQDNALAERYHVNAIPFLVLIGRDGTVSAVDLRGPQIEEAVTAALRGQKYAPNPLGGQGPLRWLSGIVGALLWAPWWLLASAIIACSTIGAAVEATLRRRPANPAA